MSQLHYFNQLIADSDDSVLALAVRAGAVPPTCLLGGIVVLQALRTKKVPCGSCEGPRNVCKGQPKMDGREELTAARRERLADAFGGLESNPELSAYAKLVSDLDSV